MAVLHEQSVRHDHLHGNLDTLGNRENKSYFIARWTDPPTPVDLLSFTARRAGTTVILRWEEGARQATGGYHVHRGPRRTRLTDHPLTGPGHFEYVDRTAPAGPTQYWIHAFDGTPDGEWHGPVHVDAMTPMATPPTPLRVHPNPTDSATTVTYFATDSAHVRLDIYDPQGRLVAHLIDGLQPAGSHAVYWDGRAISGQRVAAGAYFARLEMGGVIETQRILIVR